MQSSEWMPRGEEGEGEGLINTRQTERRGYAEYPQAVNMRRSKAVCTSKQRLCILFGRDFFLFY